MSDTAAWGMVAVSMGLGAVLLFGTPWAIIVWRARIAGRLRSVQGKLESVEIVRAGEFADLGNYFAVVGRYTYAVDGHAFSGERTALEFNLYRGEAAARAVLGGASPGEPVTVWYDSSNPKRAVLDASRPSSARFFMVGTIIGAAIALAGAIAATAAG